MEFDDFFSSLTNAAIDNQIDELATKKQEKLAETIRLKTSTIDPNYREFNPELYQVIDGDTVRNKQTGELHRISAGEGRFADTFETGLNADGTPNNYYEKNQQRFKAHRDEYARLLGKDPDDISESDLYEAGQAQKQSFQENLGNLKGQGFRLGEKDVYGRQVMNFDNPDAIGSILNSEGMNAGYSSKYNWRQLQEDRLSGQREMSKKQARDPLRWATDQVVGAVGTVGDFGIDAAILTSTILPFNNKKFDILGGNSITELLVRGKEEGWNKLREGLTSEQKLYMERMREKQSSYIQDPLYRSRKDQYMKAGDTEAMAAFKSWGQGAGDTLEHFIENPTQIVDTSIESLPYMIGSGLVASAFTKGTMQRMIANGATKGAWTKAELAAIQKVATGASIGFTAVTEGLGNGVSAYQKVMSLDEQGLANSEKYQALLAKGVAPEEAQQIVAEEAAWRTFVISGFVAGVANKLTGAGKIEANLFRRLDDIAVKNGGKDIAGKLAKTLKGTYAVSEGALKEGAEEFIQSGGGEAIAQSQAASVTDNPDLINPAASAEAAGAGVVAGMATGGVASNTSRIAKGAAKGVVKSVELGVKGVNKLKSTNTTAQAVTDNEIKASDDINKLKVHENSKVLGGTSSTAGRALAAIDKAAGGQTASNAASALDTVIGRAEKGEKILVNEAKFLLRRFVARVGENATPEQKAQIDAYQTKVDKMSQAFSESLSNRISTVAQSIQDMTKDGKGDSAEANTLWDEYASLAKAGEAYNVDAQKIFKAMTGVESMDSMPEAIQTEIRQYRTTEALMGELTRTVETANTGQKTMQRVAGEVLVGGGKKKAVRDYVELMQEAVTNRNFGDFKRNLEEMTSFVKFKEKQTRVLGKFLANMEAGMSEQEALAKAQADSNAKANKHFKFYFDKEGTSRLYFQMKRELDLMEATRQSLLGEWNTSGAPAQKSKAGKMANKEIAAYAEWADNEEIDFAAIENFVETATGESIDEARKNAIQVAKDKAIRDKAKAKEATNAARKVALDRRHYKESKYNPKSYLVKEKGAYNPVKTLKNILERYRKTGNAAEVLSALGLFQNMVKTGELQPQFLDAVRKRLRAEILSEGLIWPTQTDRRAWLAEQEKGNEKAGQPTAPAQPKGDAKAESKEATKEPTPDGAVASTEEAPQEEAIDVEINEQVAQIFEWINEIFGKDILKFVDVYATEPVADYPYLRSGFYNRETKRVGLIADQIFNRVATPGVTPKAWLTWVIFHEVGHKAVKALFGEAAADGLKAYEVALQQAYDNSPMLQELADAVANLKWKRNYKELTDPRQKMSAIEEAVVETVAALQVNDMNPEKALFALEVQWNLDGFTELYLDKFSSQSSLKKTLDAIQNVFNKLLAAIGIISPNVTKGNVEHFFMSIAAKQMEFISPQSKVTRSIPSMDDLRALSALSEADLRAFYDKVDKKSALADTLRSLLAIEEIFSDPVEEELEEDPFVGLDEQDIPDWTVEDVPIDEEDPFLTYAPEGNEGTWDDVDINEDGEQLPTVPDVTPRPEKTPVKAETKEEKEKPKPFTDAQLFNIRMAMDFLEQIISGDLDIPAHQVTMPTQAAARVWFNELERARNQGLDPTAREMAEWMMGFYEAQLASREQTAEKIRAKNTNDSKEIVSLGEKIKSGESLPVATQSMLDRTADFLSEKIMPFIWKLARHPETNHRWTRSEAMADLENNGGRALRKDLAHQFKLKGIPVWGKTFIRVAQDATTNLLNQSINVFDTIADYGVRKSVFKKLGLNEKEQMGMHTIARFVLEFQKKFDEIHLGLLNEVGLDQQINTPLRGDEKVDATGGAILNPLFKYAMQYLYDEEGKLNPNAIATMALEVGSWLTSAAANALNNDESTQKSLYGMGEEQSFPLDYALSRLLQNAVRQGTLKSEAARQIGQRIVRAMNIKVGGRNVNPTMQANLEISIGEMALAVATEMQLIESREVPSSWREAARQVELTYDEFYDTYSDEGEQMVLLMPRSEAYLGVVNDKKNSKEDRKAARADWDMGNFRESLNNKHLRTAFMGARKVLEQYFSNRSYVREPGFEVQEAPTHRARTNSRIPKKQRLAMAVMNARKWLPIKGAFRLLNIIPENSMLTVNGGHSQADIDNALDVQKDAMLSKNATILRAVEHAKNWVGDNGTKVFHFAYKMISTGRLYIDSNTINPQADKLHRFLFGMVGWDMEISTALNPTGKLAKATQLFKMSVAVALDIKFGSIGPDGISLAKLEQMVDDKMSTPLAKRAMTAILEAERTNTQLSESLLEELRREGYLAENFHSLLAIREYARYRAAKGNSIKVNLPLEIDGKTNGIAIGALQTPFTSILSRAKEDEGSSAETFFNILAATGIFVADMGADTYAEWREDPGTMDNYEGLAYDAKKVVDKLLEEGWLTDNEKKFIKDAALKARIAKIRGNVAKASLDAGFLTLTRKLAKSPLMVASYNAGIASIKRALQKVALEEYYTRLSSIRVNRTGDEAAEYDELLRQLMDVVMDMGRIIYAGSEREFHQTKDGVEVIRKVRDARLDPYSADFEKSIWGNRKAKEAALREAFPTFEELDAYRKSNEGLNPAARPDPDGYDIIDFRGELVGFNIVISATFGKGIQVGIENRLGPMKEVRSALNNGVMLMNMIAKNYYERMVVQMTKSLGRNLTPSEMELIARNMQKKGWIPSVRTAEADNLDEYLELHDEADQVILGPTGEPVSARASFRKRLALKTVSFLKSGFLGTPKGQVHSGSSLFGFGMGLNLGVRALVKSIHSSDGSVMTRILGEENANYLGVHDAIVGNPLDLLDAAVTSNMHFIDVQSEWDLGSEVQKSLSRFMQLMTDPLHFTDKDRSAVMYAFDAIISKFWEGYDKEGTIEDNFNYFIADFDGLVERNTEARVELFKLLTNGSINQFAIDEGNYSIGQSLSSIIAKIDTTDSAWKVMSNREGLRLSEEVQAAILDIAFNRLEGNPLKVFVDYLAGQNREGVNFSDALDVVWGAFNTLVRQDEKNRSRDRLREAINVLKGSSVMVVDGESIPLRVEVDADNRGIGTEYRKSTHTIILRPGDNIEDVLGDLLRYGMIASTAAKLSELYADPKDRALVIKQILSRAVKWANEKGQDKGKARARELVVALAGAPNRASTQLKLITEYLSNIQGSLKETAQGLAFDFDGKQVQQSLNDMMKIMAEGKDKVVFFSSPRGVNQSRFDGIEGRTLTYDTVKELLATFSQTDNLTEEEQIFLDEAAKLLEKGLLGIDELLLKQVDGQIDQLNEGEYVDENSTILLETTDNVLSSPVGMSKQEVLLHEIFHPLLKLVTQHSNLKDRLREIYDLAVAEVDAGRLTWRIFLPQTPGIDPQLDETLAKERFAHIFSLTRNPDGTFNKAEHEIRYHEFFAIAMTNKVFGDALRKIPTRGDKYVFWQNNLFTTIAAAVAEAFRWLLGAARRDNKNLKEALDHLAQDVMAANRRHQKLAKKAQDSGPIQGAMNWMDRKILERFSSLNAAKLQEWARKNALNYQDIKKELDSKDSQLSKLFAAAKSATASVLDERMDMEEFRNALESAMLGYKKNGTVYQLLQELLPWADRNNRFVDLLRRSNVLIDANRQKIIETMKGTMKDIFDPFRRLTDPERSALSKVILRTDLSALLDAGLDATGIMDLLFDKNKVIERITATLTTMEQVVNNPWLMERFNLQSRSLAHLMIHGTPLTGVPHSEYNAYNIVKTQAYLEIDKKIEFDAETEAQLIQLMDELTTLRAILELPQKTLDVARGVVEHEMARPTDVNGFSGTLALARNHKIVSLEKNFRGNPTQVWKGYVYETFDEDIDVKFVADTPFNELALTNDGYRKVQTLPASKLLPDVDVKFKNVAIYVSKSKGVNTYSKSMINLTSEQKHGFGMFDLHLTVDEWNDKAPGKSASQVISLVEELDFNAQYEFDRAVRGGKVDAGAPLIPLYNEDGRVVDMRYVMSEEHKVKYLGKREYIDEILPRMMGAIDDRSNTPVINHEVVDMLYQEWQKYRNDKDHRFLMVGSREKGKDHRSTIALKNDLVKARIEKKQAADANDTFKEQMLDRRIKSLKDRIASQEMWDLLPKETQLYAEQLFGGKFMVVRDEMYNMVFGFRKLAFANNKWLGKAAPFVRIVEKIWQEVIQWERFRIAVLQPSVVIGNMISNTFVLLAHGVPPQYIWRYFNEAVLGMRAYQKNLTNAQKLKHQIAINQQYGKPVAALEAKLSRLEELIETSEVHEIVEEGLFTSIVEEFGGDEQSYRRRLTNKLLDKVGVVSGSQSAVKLAQEVYMVPGSQMARFALMGTQYGDFVARYIKLKWDKDVKKVPHEKAIREALDTFIYYNIPQNKYLQWMNDNGLFMFTKFFFRIQHIAFRLFQRSPTRAAAAFAFQAQYEHTVLGDSVGGYLGDVARMFKKFDPTPFDNVTDGDIFDPSLFKWMGIFFGD